MAHDPLLSQRARHATTSAIRDLLEHAQRPGMISLAGGLPDPALFPVDHLASIADQEIRANSGHVLQYGLTAGDIDLRHHIVETTPAATDIDHVVVTTGSQQALQLLSAVVLDPGDTVVVAEPEYLGAMQAFHNAGAELTGIPIDHGGIDLDQLEDALAAGLRPKMVYLVPHFHNPSGSTLSSSRLERLFALASHHGFLVVLDDPYRELTADGETPVEPDAHPMAVHLRSTSKILAPGLRVGWLIGPRWLTIAIERAKQSADLHTSTVSQAIARRALAADWFPTHLATLRSATRTKRDALCDALDATLGERISFTRPGGGMFVWATLSGVESTDVLLTRALDRGVAFVPGSAFAVTHDLSSCLRLSWATANTDELIDAVSRLARSVEIGSKR